MTRAPEVSFVIPVFNEEAILHAAVVDLRERLAPLDLSYELILAENGSLDATADIARKLCARYPELRLVQSPEPNYGAALRQGILGAHGEWVICEEIDLCDVDFHQQALALLRRGDADFVIGSKLIGRRARRAPVFAPQRKPALHGAPTRAARLSRHRHARPEGFPARAARADRRSLSHRARRVRQ